MPWNQPGGSGGKDPWGSRGDRDGPPDLDDLMRRFRQRLGGLFGGGGGSGGGGSSDGLGSIGFGLIAAILVFLWLATGFYVVKQGEAAVILRLGAYAQTTGAGLHWRLPYPIESQEIVNVEKVNTVAVGYRIQDRSGGQRSAVPLEALMLTKDENIVDIQFAVQYRIGDPKQLLFNVSDSPEFTVRSATESVVREIVGKNDFDFVITSGRGKIVSDTEDLLQKILDRYETGIAVVTVEMQDAKAPEQVKDAFDDAVKAREDEERLKNEAQAYAKDVVPRARGQAARLMQEAEGYKVSVTARAEGEARRFEQILTEYRKAPQITRERLYIEAMEQVLQNSSKVMVDQKGGNNILYLPLEQMLQQQRTQSLPAITTDSVGSGSGDKNDTRAPARSDLRPDRGN